MRSFFLINFLVHISLIAVACEDDSTSDDLLYPETIIGHWDIEGGGTLFFEEENFSASVGCNTLFGPLTIEGNTLVFSVILSTLIGCPDSEVRREQELSTLLDSATLTYRIKNNHAYLENIQGQKVLNLIRPINVELVNAWKLNSLRTEMAVSSSILDDDSGITFLSDGKVSIQTACNSGVGVFSLKDELFSLKDLIFNEMACQKERMIREEEFIQSLQKVNSYSILRKTLFLKRDGIVYLTFQQVK
ncbi:MAG: hypothetical protein CMC00_05635 [Flavobacteriaceae bacterium]|nr:hypothetical protein [Flavobacteriaceae bacterium]